jgi:hypothetical protein
MKSHFFCYGIALTLLLIPLSALCEENDQQTSKPLPTVPESTSTASFPRDFVGELATASELSYLAQTLQAADSLPGYTLIGSTSPNDVGDGVKSYDNFKAIALLNPSSGLHPVWMTPA